MRGTRCSFSRDGYERILTSKVSIYYCHPMVYAVLTGDSRCGSATEIVWRSIDL